MRTQNNSSQNSSYGPCGDGAEIAYSIVDSALGRLLVAGTQRGNYPRATIRVANPNRHEDSRIGQWADALADYIAGSSKMPTPPMDIRGTPFQFSVWEQLLAIPAGETRSYSEIARRIGRPRAIRAVGTANGANPVSIIIPCHRAIRASGHLGGYRWGLERKRLLLEMEARVQPLRLSEENRCGRGVKPPSVHRSPKVQVLPGGGSTH